jgi:hypothetical protein
MFPKGASLWSSTMFPKGASLYTINCFCCSTSKDLLASYRVLLSIT